MTLLKVNSQGFLKYQKPVTESTQLLRRLTSTSPGLVEEKPKYSPEKKLLKVAIVGRPNAGKSTLINKILNLNLCGVSCKTHTTRTPFKAAFTRGETQVVFLDTPGLVTQKEYSRFKLPEEFLKWKEPTLEEADVIGVVHEVTEPRSISKFHMNLTQNIKTFPESKTVFLVLNKVDLVIDKNAFEAAVDSYMRPRDENSPESDKAPKLWRRFSKVFFTSALHNRGVTEVADYLLEQAKPGEWLFGPGQFFDQPLHQLVVDLVRCQLMDILPSEIPYLCKYEVEYLKENDLGEMICVALVTCRYSRHVHLITSGKKGNLRTLCKQLESDLYKICGKVFRESASGFSNYWKLLREEWLTPTNRMCGF